jgi:hypothetical protein
METYKCGHSPETIILDNNLLSLSAYYRWENTVGIYGDKTLCWDCFNEKEKKE